MSVRLRLQSTVTCPRCRARHTVTMPTDRCMWQYTCPGCSARLTPRPDDCCVFCSYGDVPCPGVQARGPAAGPVVRRP